MWLSKKNPGQGAITIVERASTTIGRQSTLPDRQTLKAKKRKRRMKRMMTRSIRR
jgi:hypothetical protein